VVVLVRDQAVVFIPEAERPQRSRAQFRHSRLVLGIRPESRRPGN
jgi:hypothetical protein